MTLLMGVVFILIVAGVVAGLVSGKIAGGLDDPTTTIPPRGFEAGPVAPADVASLRFVPALRGYRMDQVDAALERLSAELAARDEEIARLKAAASPAVETEAAPVSFAPPAADATLPEEAVVPAPESAVVAAEEPVVVAAEEPVTAAPEESVVAEPVVAEPVVADVPAESQSPAVAAQPAEAGERA